MIIDRIKRKIDPQMLIVPQSTPVIYFGNYDKAKACTISLNPSNKEFVDKSGRLLDERNHERLCSRKRLNKSDNEELTDNDANIVLNYCTDYFKLRPFKQWFDPFSYFIERYGGYSYYKDSCVHLDLSQWATSEKWSKIPENLRYKLVTNDLPVLKYLLNKDFEIMFLNGKTVVDNISECLDINLKNISTTLTNKNEKDIQIIIYHGEYKNIEVVGWNIYLQSAAVGGKDNKNIFCDLIKKHLSK